MSGNEPQRRRLLRYRTEVLRLERDSTDKLPDARLPADLRAFADVWQRLRGDRAAPLKRDIGPFSIPSRLLPNVMLWEILGDDYLCRLAGTGLRARAERELTGCLLSEIYGDDGHDAWEEFDGVAGGGLYSLVERAVIWDELPASIRTRLLLPLLRDDGEVRFLVALTGPGFRYAWKPGVGAIRADDAPRD